MLAGKPFQGDGSVRARQRQADGAGQGGNRRTLFCSRPAQGQYGRQYFRRAGVLACWLLGGRWVAAEAEVLVGDKAVTMGVDLRLS